MKALLVLGAAFALTGCATYPSGAYYPGSPYAGTPYVDAPAYGYGSGFTIGSGYGTPYYAAPYSAAPYYYPPVVAVPVPVPTPRPHWTPRDRNGDGVINRDDRRHWHHPRPESSVSGAPPRPATPRTGPPRPRGEGPRSGGNPRPPRAQPLPNGSGA